MKFTASWEKERQRKFSLWTCARTECISACVHIMISRLYYVYCFGKVFDGRGEVHLAFSHFSSVLGRAKKPRQLHSKYTWKKKVILWKFVCLPTRSTRHGHRHYNSNKPKIWSSRVNQLYHECVYIHSTYVSVFPSTTPMCICKCECHEVDWLMYLYLWLCPTYVHVLITHLFCFLSFRTVNISSASIFLPIDTTPM